MSHPGKMITLHGREQCLKHWAREFNIPVNTLRTRLERGTDLLTALTATRAGYGYRSVKGAYGISRVWREWVSAPALNVK